MAAQPTKPLQSVSIYREMREELNTRQQDLSELLPKQIPAARFIRAAAWAVQSDAKLSQCSKRSLISACMRAAADGLLPDGREGAIVAYETNTADGRREMQAQWIAMVQGIRKKVFNTGLLAQWTVQVVQSGDFFDYELGDHPYIRHKPSLRGGRDRPVIAAYSIATYPDGSKSYEIMNIDQINDIAKKSRARRGPWADPIFFPEMARKTVARLHSKQLPMSSDILAIFHREDEDEERIAAEPPPPASLTEAPSSTRAALSQFAPQTAPPASASAPIEHESESPAPQQAQPQSQPASKAKPKEPAPLPKTPDDYWKRYEKARDAATTRANVDMLERWFHSDAEKKVRAGSGISFPMLDELEGDLRKHAASVRQEQTDVPEDDDEI